MHFITHVGEDFQDADLSFIVVLPPPVGVGYVVQLSLLSVAYSVRRILDMKIRTRSRVSEELPSTDFMALYKCCYYYYYYKFCLCWGHC